MSAQYPLVVLSGDHMHVLLIYCVVYMWQTGCVCKSGWLVLGQGPFCFHNEE